MTVSVTVTLRDTLGALVPNARVWAKLFVPDTYTDYSIPVGFEVEGTTAETGKVTLAVWPNALSSEDTYYRFRAWHPTTKKKILDVSVVIPNADANLEDLAPPVPTEVQMVDVQVMISAAFASFINQFLVTTEKILDLGTISGNQVLDLAVAQNFRYKLGGDVAFTIQNAYVSSPITSIDTITTIMLYSEQDTTGGWLETFPGMTIRNPRGNPQSPNTAAGARNIGLMMTIDSGTTWDKWLVGNGQA